MLFARASLKPYLLRNAFLPVTELSRAFCAGLIEASPVLYILIFVPHVIPCFLRGPH